MSLSYIFAEAAHSRVEATSRRPRAFSYSIRTSWRFLHCPVCCSRYSSSFVSFLPDRVVKVYELASSTIFCWDNATLNTNIWCISCQLETFLDRVIYLIDAEDVKITIDTVLLGLIAAISPTLRNPQFVTLDTNLEEDCDSVTHTSLMNGYTSQADKKELERRWKSLFEGYSTLVATEDIPEG